MRLELSNEGIDRIPILHNDTRMINNTCLSESTKEVIRGMLAALIKTCNVKFINRAVFELKFPPEGADPDSDEEESRAPKIKKRF